MKTKFLFMLSLLSFILIVFFSSNVYGVSVDYNDNSYTFPDDLEAYEYKIIYYFSFRYSGTIDEYLVYFTTTQEPFISISSNGDKILGFTNSDVLSHKLNLKTGEITVDSRHSNYTSNNYTYLDDSNLLYNNFDIKDTNGNVVFQAPVLTTETLTLGEVLEKANPVETFQTMTHGMIIYLIVFLVGLVAFWKAWSLLSKTLRKA